MSIPQRGRCTFTPVVKRICHPCSYCINGQTELLNGTPCCQVGQGLARYVKRTRREWLFASFLICSFQLLRLKVLCGPLFSPSRKAFRVPAPVPARLQHSNSFVYNLVDSSNTPCQSAWLSAGRGAVRQAWLTAETSCVEKDQRILEIIPQSSESHRLRISKNSN